MGSHGRAENSIDCRTATHHCSYLELSQPGASLLGLNCRIRMKLYHVTMLNVGQEVPGTGGVFGVQVVMLF